MRNLFYIISSWLSLPLYVVQGIWIRQKSLRLSPAKGPRSGQFGSGKPEMRILAVGDSSCAGVGIDNTSGTIAAQLAQLANTRFDCSVSWSMSGHNSAVAEEIRDHVVPNLPQQDFTHIFIMIGTNDMKNWHTGARWKKGFGGLLYALRARFPEARIYWHQAIDLTQVPRLPQPLATIMNWRRALLNRKGAQLCLERGIIAIPPLPNAEAEGYCRDGFHANEAGYEAWANHMLDYLDETPESTPAVAGL